MSEPRARLKVGTKEPPLHELFKYERNPFWATYTRYERDKSGRIFSFPLVDKGNVDINEDSPVYPNELSHNVVSPRPILHDCLGWEPRFMARHEPRCAMALSMSITGSVDSLATDLQAYPAHIHMTCGVSVRR
eukprot:3729078-Pleurochrysis_carterae.AAC.1